MTSIISICTERETVLLKDINVNIMLIGLIYYVNTGSF